jgi:hypothetical protein
MENLTAKPFNGSKHNPSISLTANSDITGLTLNKKLQ